MHSKVPGVPDYKKWRRWQETSKEESKVNKLRFFILRKNLFHCLHTENIMNLR